MKLDPQTSIYETTLDNAELEVALEARETTKAAAAAARKAYSETHEHAKSLVDGLDLGEGAPVRVGRFVLEQRPIVGRSVAFETAPSTRLLIRALDEGSES